MPSIPSEEYPDGVIYDPADAVRLAILPAEADGPDRLFEDGLLTGAELQSPGDSVGPSERESDFQETGCLLDDPARGFG